MARLPIPGSDEGQWGAILNEFLSVAHTGGGDLKQAGLITGAQQMSQKGQANGYASLNSSGKLPTTQLPGIGDYLGVRSDGSVALPDDTYDQVAWTTTTASNGSSLALGSDPTQVQILQAGVYAITVTINWNDANGITSGGRFVQIFTLCQFLVQDYRPGFGDPVNESIQTVTTALYLEPGDDIVVTLRQTTGADLSPVGSMLVTRCA